MIVILFSLLFFAITFGPRYFAFQNFNFGFYDLGLYAQTFCDFKQGYFNPYIPSAARAFFEMRPEPFFAAFYPLSQVTTEPALFIFIDEIAVILTAVICAHFVWRKSQSSLLTYSLFLTILFSFFTFESLHGVARIALWLMPSLALFFREYYSKRRPLQLGLFLALMCFTHLAMCAVGFVMVPFSFLTQTKRWHTGRRLEVALTLATVSLLGLVALHFFEGTLHFEWPLLLGPYGKSLLKVAASFLLLPLFSPEILASGLVLAALVINYGHVEGAAFLPLGVIGTVATLKRLRVFDHPWRSQAAAFGVLVAFTSFNFLSPDLLFHFWQKQRWQMSDTSHQLNDFLTHVPPNSTVGVSDVLSPMLACHSGLMTITSLAEQRLPLEESPLYVVCLNEPCPAGQDIHYRQVEINLQTKTRLLLRIK